MTLTGKHPVLEYVELNAEWICIPTEAELSPESPGLRAGCNFHCSCFAQVSTVFQILCYSLADQEWKIWLDVSKQMLHCTVLCRKNGFDTWETGYRLVFLGIFTSTKKNQSYISEQKLYIRFWCANLCGSKMLLQSVKKISMTLMEMLLKFM